MLSIRKIGVIGRTYRHLNRYRQILAILFKYGFGDLLDRLSIDQYIGAGLQAISRKRAERVSKLTRPQRLRMAFEELGPTYIKLGQILSSRPDLVPVDILQELARLQDAVPPFPFEDAKAAIESEFGVSAEELFDRLDQKPLASASIGQVHKGLTTDGEPVAVKFQRPDIQKIIEVDLEIMLHLATLAERHIKEFEIHRPVKIVEEFARTLEKEIDYRIEATNMERIARRFLDLPHVYIPAVFREYTTSRVLTTELIEGIKISKIDSILEAGLDQKIIADRLVGLVLKQAFEHGFFHADPHPGNLFVRPLPAAEETLAVEDLAGKGLAAGHVDVGHGVGAADDGQPHPPASDRGHPADHREQADGQQQQRGNAVGCHRTVHTDGLQHKRRQQLQIISDRDEIRPDQHDARQEGNILSRAVSFILDGLEMTDVEANRTADRVGQYQQQRHAEDGQIAHDAAEQWRANQKPAAHDRGERGHGCFPV